MDFRDNKPIYQQIVDFCYERILIRDWKEEERIPSVRELGSMLQVNPNTVMRAFEHMQEEAIIFSKRGMGYFIQLNARNKILLIKKREFFKDWLPDLFNQMKILEINMEEIEQEYTKTK